MTPSKIMHSLQRRMVAGLQPCQKTAAAHPDAGPYHGCFHSRCGETVFPKVFLGLARQDTLPVENRLQVADRLVRQQSPDGIWHETPGTWKGTTLLQLKVLCERIAGPWEAITSTEPRRVPFPALIGAPLRCRLRTPISGTYRASLEMSVEADRCDRADAGALCPG